MKILLVVILSGFATSAFGQSAAPQTAVAPGCGDGSIKFDVKTNRSQHPFAKPDPGKALVYFLQDDSFFQSVPRPTTRFGLNGSWVGATNANAYFYVPVDPGEQHICAGWQSFVGFSTGDKNAAAHFTAEAGNSYFFVARNHFLREHGIASIKLEPVDSDEAQLLMTKFGFSTSHARK